MDDPQDPNKRQRRTGSPKKSFNHVLIFLSVLVLVLLFVNNFSQGPSANVIEFSQFRDKVESGEIKEVKLTSTKYLGYDSVQDTAQTSSSPASQFNLFVSPTNPSSSTDTSTVYETVPVNDTTFIPLLEEKGVAYYAELEKPNYWLGALSWMLPLIFIFIIMRMLTRKIGGMGGPGGVMNFGQNKSKIVSESDIQTKFADVAGCNEAKEELVEVVDFLKNPKKYSEIGGKIPKGVLLVGPPGTGKTLIARAVAGESNVTFFKMSGAEFVEMFVGVGAARVRDLFKQAREKSPAIIFIDELDAIGKSRASSYSTNDEREQTLNQLLVEMDGFDASSGVIVIAATNRPEVLDSALLRPGRFDRQVLIDKPDLLGRQAILEIHSKNIKLSSKVDLEKIAKATTGFVGADLANLANEAAILAVRKGRKFVIQDDLTEAIEKILIGLQKRNRLINPKEREIVAYHETGHALIAAFTPDSNPVQRISILPRGMSALGYMLQVPTEDRFLMSEHELIGEIDVLLGGRASEQVIYGAVTTGASNDIERATEIIRKMFTIYGFNKKFYNMALSTQSRNFLGGQEQVSNYSEVTKDYLDNEIAKLIDQRYKHVTAILANHKDLLQKITHRLLDIEDMESEEFFRMIDEDENGQTTIEERKAANQSEVLATLYGKESGEKRNEAIKKRLEAENVKTVNRYAKKKEKLVATDDGHLSIEQQNETNAEEEKTDPE